jgi:hypothetical protein
MLSASEPQTVTREVTTGSPSAAGSRALTTKTSFVQVPELEQDPAGRACRSRSVRRCGHDLRVMSGDDPAYRRLSKASTSRARYAPTSSRLSR